MLTLKTIGDSLKKARRVIKSPPLRILEIPEKSEKWLVTETGEKLRTVCGIWQGASQRPCLLPAGWMTPHPGKGNCRKHTRGGLYNIILNQESGYPTQLQELLLHTESLDESEIMPLELDIKLLYALQQYTMSRGIEGQLGLDQIDLVRKITGDILKAKTIKHKIQREMKLDNTTVKEFVNQIFKTISENVQGPEAKRLMEDIMNKVIVPFQSTDRLSDKDFTSEAQVHRYLGDG